MKKFAFVILHYYTIEDTKKCVLSILDKCNNVEIIIVDNASPNGTGKELENLYKNSNNIKVIINEENLGFSRGNNIGFKYAKENLDVDFIILCNNDTYLLQDNFFELVEEEYKNSEFAVLGPQIMLPDNKINVVVKEMPNLEQLKKQLYITKLDYITKIFYINGLYRMIRKVLTNFLITFKLKKKEVINENNVELRYENIILHGSFLIFSKKYIDKFDGLNDSTFLYREEELLALRLQQNKLKNVYNPKIKIFHNEDSATNAITKSNRKKVLFVYKNQIKSTNILIQEWRSYNDRSL